MQVWLIQTCGTQRTMFTGQLKALNTYPGKEGRLKINQASIPRNQKSSTADDTQGRWTKKEQKVRNQ